MSHETEIAVNDKMQRGYNYKRSQPVGCNFAAEFKPAITPSQMLEMGVFEGRYINDCAAEFPADWFLNAKISPTPDPKLNYFGVKSRQPLEVWQSNGWIYGPDQRGWFQWYCRYYLGRRLDDIDRIQVRRWKGFARHAGQIRANCYPRDIFCRPRQRQALLQWAHDPFI